MVANQVNLHMIHQYFAKRNTFLRRTVTFENKTFIIISKVVNVNLIIMTNLFRSMHVHFKLYLISRRKVYHLLDIILNDFSFNW